MDARQWRVMLLGAALVAGTATPCAGQTVGTRANDPVWNGVVIGMASGAATGLVLTRSKSKEPGPCSDAGCAVTLGLLGGAIGLGADALVRRERIVEPGMLIDDSRRNGRLIGAAVGASIGLIGSVRQKDCEGSPCGAVYPILVGAAGAAAGALIGGLIDAAIPSRVPDSAVARSTASRAHRRPVVFRVGWSF